MTDTTFDVRPRDGRFHTNAGWLMLIVALMCLPFGLMLFTLGAAKWLGHKRP